ncbi:citrate synthase family protein [Pendulispora albinea]|uniref:citrate synthase (unknown stereospecificity) n=1 Tax=Pendulispora albinea TaxID=2741071 RepID=A0ABZ2M5M1_9BACT
MLINVDSTIHTTESGASFISSREACAWLGIRRETLYAYVSRGLVRSFPAAGKGRGRRYLREDVLRLKARHDARSGHGAVAAGALRWGEPVLDSSITEITADGPRYRGHLALDLVVRGARFEQVAELLWTGVLPDLVPHWTPAAIPEDDMRTARLAQRPYMRLPLLLATWAITAPLAPAPTASSHRRTPTPESIRTSARPLLAALPWILRPRRWAEASSRASTLAERICILLKRPPHPDRVRLIDATLILSADHELNVSSFTARVVASSGADLHAVLSAAAGAFSGPRHGTVSDDIEALVRDAASPRRARRIVDAYARRNEALPGFGHRFYRGGDPRGRELLARAAALAPDDPNLRTLAALVQAAEQKLDQHPNLDLGLVAVACALGAPRGTAATLFALGRAAGWVAHALEQCESGALIRPRARYVERGAG